MNWLRYVFPYRHHLEQEVEYLRGQVSQEKRRSDVFEGAYREVLGKLATKAASVPRGTPEYIPGKPVGVDAVKFARNRDRKPEAETGDEAGLSAESAERVAG